MKTLLVLLVVVASVAPTERVSAQESTPHAAAAQCRADPEQLDTETCVDVCLGCHLTRDGAQDVFYLSDRSICDGCHQDKTREERPASRLLNIADHGNHPVGVLYSDQNLFSRLYDQPDGPKLFTDADGRGARIFCSTCHNPHSAEPRLLRKQPRDDLCRACHVRW